MKTPPPLRYSVDLRTFTVIDTLTGERIQCNDIMHMAQVRRDMELKAKPVTGRRVKEQW